MSFEQKSVEQVQRILRSLETRITKLEQSGSVDAKTLKSYKQRLEKWKNRLQLQLKNSWEFNISSFDNQKSGGRYYG